MRDSLASILIVDDEPGIVKFLCAGLEDTDFRTIIASSGKEAVSAVATHNPDLVLLDIGLPDMDGFEVISKIRGWSKIPIIVLSARGLEGDKIRALDLGADDYLTKPFSVGELRARVKAHLRRQARTIDNTKSIVSFGDCDIDLSAHIVRRSGKEIHLTPTEFKLLHFLIEHADKVVPHGMILKHVWGSAYERETQYLRVFMGALRHKLEANPADPKYLKNEPGVGYRLVTTL